jgi:hypothetical protein
MTPILFLLSFSESFIRNMDKPPCVQCQYYLPEGDSFTSTESKCMKFGGKDLHTGIILYDYADSVRSNEAKCSTAGTYFKGETYLFLKKIIYWLKQWMPYKIDDA